MFVVVIVCFISWYLLTLAHHHDHCHSYSYGITPSLETLQVLMRKSQECIFVFPLPPSSNREVLPEFIMRLESGELKNCHVRMDEVVMEHGGDLTEEFVIVQISTNKEKSSGS